MGSFVAKYQGLPPPPFADWLTAILEDHLSSVKKLETRVTLAGLDGVSAYGLLIREQEEVIRLFLTIPHYRSSTKDELVELHPHMLQPSANYCTTLYGSYCQTDLHSPSTVQVDLQILGRKLMCEISIDGSAGVLYSCRDVMVQKTQRASV